MQINRPIRVMIADDHAIVRTGLIAVIQACTEFTLVAEAGNGLEAVELARQTQPDVVLMDLTMPLMDGPTATRLICEKMPEIKILILTSHNEEKLIQQALAAGAAGYLLKTIEAHELIAAIRTVYSGAPVLAPQVTQLLMQAANQYGTPRLGSDLTNREYEVLRFMIRGYTNGQIAQVLTVSRATIKLHVSNILSKLHAASRTEAVAITLRFNLLPE